MRVRILALVLVAGCGKDPGTVGDDDQQTPIDAPADAYIPAVGYTKLIGRSWSLAVGAKDIYRCVRLTITQDMYITNFMAEAPLGSHHTVLSIAGANGTSGPDGEYDCAVQSLGMVMLYASGVGTSPLDFPSGVGIKITAGQQIHLNLHLYNASDNGLSGTSAIWVKAQTAPPATLAEMVFAGTFTLDIPSTGQTVPITGSCTATSDYSLFAIWPHMHKLATHQLVEQIRGTTTTKLHDLPFSFSEQKYYPKTPIVQVLKDDTIRVTCSYVNNTGHSVSFGDSSDEEMCFSGLYRYPAKGSGIFACSM